MPAGAVLDGHLDTSEAYPNVGMIQAVGSDGVWWFGSGTLIGPNVMVTSAHVADLRGTGLVPANVRVSFDVAPASWGPIPEGGTWYFGKAIELHPNWDWPAVRGLGVVNSKRWIGAAEDLALLWLDRPVEGIVPAGLIGPGDLDELDLKRERFTLVGYGVNGFVVGAAPAWRNPNVGTRSGRNVADAEVVTEHEAYADRYLKFTGGFCFGDSGGPLFHDGVVVAVNNWTGGLRCEAPGFGYRLDSEVAQSFLSTWLD